jgi:hypothetical protein
MEPIKVICFIVLKEAVPIVTIVPQISAICNAAAARKEQRAVLGFRSYHACLISMMCAVQVRSRLTMLWEGSINRCSSGSHGGMRHALLM